MKACLSFDALLDYLDEESGKWEEWFGQNPRALEVKVDIAEGSDVRELLFHIFAVEHIYGERLNEEPSSPPDKIPHETVEVVFETGRKARARLRDFVATRSDERLDEKLTFKTRLSGEMTVSCRKCLTQAITHSIRHWAQLATALRQAGFKQPWGHDFLQSHAME